jgi:hypothetical protein
MLNNYKSHKTKITFLTRKRHGAIKICEDNICKKLQELKDFELTKIELPYGDSFVANIFNLFYCLLKIIPAYYKSDIISMFVTCNYFIVLNPLLKVLFRETKTVGFLTHFNKLNDKSFLADCFYKHLYKSFDT